MRNRRQELPISPQYMSPEVLGWAAMSNSRSSALRTPSMPSAAAAPSPPLPYEAEFPQPSRQEMERYLGEVSRQMVQKKTAGCRQHQIPPALPYDRPPQHQQQKHQQQPHLSSDPDDDYSADAALLRCKDFNDHHEEEASSASPPPPLLPGTNSKSSAAAVCPEESGCAPANTPTISPSSRGGGGGSRRVKQQFYNPQFDTAAPPMAEATEEKFFVAPTAQQVLEVPGRTEFCPSFMQSAPARITNANGEVPSYAFALCTPVLEARRFLANVLHGLGGNLGNGMDCIFRADLLAAAGRNSPDNALYPLWQRWRAAREAGDFAVERQAESQLILGQLRVYVGRSRASELLLCGIPASAAELRDLIELLGLPQCAVMLIMNPRLAMRKAQHAFGGGGGQTATAEDDDVVGRLCEEVAEFECSWNEVSRFVSSNNICSLRVSDLGRRSVADALSDIRASLLKSLVPAGEAGSSNLRRIAGRRIRL